MEELSVESGLEEVKSSSKEENIRETLLHIQETLAKHEKELQEPYAVQDAIFQMNAVTKKVEQITLDINNIREKSYEASVLVMASNGQGSSDALKLLRGDLEALRMVSRRIELHQSTEALSFHNLRELQRGSRRTTTKVDELERQIIIMKAEHAREMTMLRKMIADQAGMGVVGGRKNRPDEEEDEVVSEDEDETKLDPSSTTSQYYQRLARRRKRVRHRRAREGFDLDIGALDDELEEIARGLDTHKSTIDTLQTEVVRLERQRQMDQQRYKVFTGARLLSRVVHARQKMAIRRRWEGWQHFVSLARLQSTKGHVAVLGEGVDRRVAGHALILQQALARVGCWDELRMRPRFDRWREHTALERHIERWQPAFERCMGRWRTYSLWLRGPVVTGESTRRCLRQWKRVTALAVAGLTTMTNLSLVQQAEPYLTTNQDPAAASVVDESKHARFVASLLSLLAANVDSSGSSTHDSDSDDYGSNTAISNAVMTTRTRMSGKVSDDVDAAVTAARDVWRARTRDPLLKMGYVRGDLEALAVVTGLVGRLSIARQARFEALRATDAGAVAKGMQGVGAELGEKLEKQREQLAHSLLMVQRGAEEALGGCREDLVRRLHETTVTFDNKLASTAFRIRSLDTQMAETAEGARRSEEQVLLCNSKLEKVLLEHGSQVMRVAVLETAHTHYLADRVKAEKERQVLQHVTGEISVKLVELTNTSATHEGRVRGELDRLVRGSSALSEHVGGLETRLAQAVASTTRQETRLTTVEGIAAGMVTLEPTGKELGRLCVAFEDKVLRQHKHNGTINSPPASSSSYGATGSGLPSVHLNMILDEDTAEQLARFVVRLARHMASRCDTAVVCGVVRDPRAPPNGAGPLAAGPGKQHMAGKDWSPYPPQNIPGKHHPPSSSLTAEEEVLARRDAFIRDFEGDFIRALKDSGNGSGGDSGNPGVLRCEARVVFHRRFVSALELALTAHPVMALDVPSTLGRTSSSSHHQPPPPAPHNSSHVHTSVVTRDVGNLLLPPSGHGHSNNNNNNSNGEIVRSGSVRPRSASSAGRVLPRTTSSLATSGMMTTMTTTNPNISLAGMLEAQLRRGDFDHDRLHLGTTTAVNASLLATSISERTLSYNQSNNNHDTTGSLPWQQQQQLNASGNQACLACNRPLRETGGKPPPRLSSMPLLLSSFEQEMAVLSTQDRVARHSALAAGAIVQAAATLHSAGSQAHQTAGWTQGPHYPHRQHPSRPSSADHMSTTRPRSATAVTGTARNSATNVDGIVEGRDGMEEVNSAASHTSSDLGQLSHQSNQPPESALMNARVQDGDLL